MAGRVLRVYLAASMRGGGDGKGWGHLKELALIIAALGHVPMNEVCEDKAPKVKVSGKGDDYLYNRDMAWLELADCLIAEVTYPSLGVGYEIAAAIREQKIPVLALYQKNAPELSAMLNGNTDPLFHLQRYTGSGEMEERVRRFLGNLTNRKA
jgi:2'-deoxynucleoside 5'-phosphate N-hydrolase